MRNNNIAKAVLVIIAIVIIILGIIITVDVCHYNSYVSIEATVADIVVDNGNGAEALPVYYAVLSYSYNGKTYEYKNYDGTSNRLNKGDKVKILCNPDNCNEVKNERTLTVLIVVEIVLIVWSGLLLFSMIRVKKSPTNPPIQISLRRQHKKD